MSKISGCNLIYKQRGNIIKSTDGMLIDVYISTGVSCDVFILFNINLIYNYHRGWKSSIVKYFTLCTPLTWASTSKKEMSDNDNMELNPQDV